MSNSPDWPCPFTVRYWEHIPGSPDPHRNPATFTPPLDQPGTEVPVYGWAIPSSTVPGLAGHPERVIDSGELYAPAVFVPTPHSVIGLPEGRFEVVADVGDFNHGPFDWAPGNVTNLRKVVG